MREDYKKQLSSQIEKHFSDLEMRIMEDIVRRIRKTGKITSTVDWQINRLRILGYSSEDIEQMLKEALDKSYPEMFELYDKVIDWEYVRNKDIYEQINAEYIPYEDNEELQQITEALIQQSGDELQNITKSLGFYLDYGTGEKILTPLAQVYQKYLDAACMDIVSGAFDYNTVIRRVVTQLTNSGLRQIDYSSGRANRIDVAARRAVMTGVSQLSGKISEMNAQKLGTEYFEVEWHAGARPTHAVWQGRVYSKEELTTVCGLGSVTGLLGVNCYHMYYPFIPGISVRNWADEWLEEQSRKENVPKDFQGKEYTLYEAKQRQRQMETCMRAQREKVDLLKKGGADPDDVMIARAKYQGQLNEYSRFCKKMGLTEERERIYYDMRGRVAPNKNTYTEYLRKQEIARNAEKSIAGAGKGDIIKIDAVPGSSKYRKLRRAEIIKMGIESEKSVFAVDKFGKLAEELPPIPGYYDVIMHGATKFVQIFGERSDVKIVADILRGRTDYNGEPIRLLSCNTGKGENCFAQMLANELGIIVEAPNDIIWARSDKTYTIGPTKYKNTGKMIKFYPERRSQ